MSRLPKMMIGFIVRRCAAELGHSPNTVELAAWANDHGSGDPGYCLFGRPITEAEAAVILRHQARLVTSKSAAPHEQYVEDDSPAPKTFTAGKNVVSLAEVRERLIASRNLRRRQRGG